MTQIADDFLPAATGQNLGSTTQRWNANLQNVDISGTVTAPSYNGVSSKTANIGDTTAQNKYLWLYSTFPLYTDGSYSLGLHLAVSSDGLRFQYLQAGVPGTNRANVLYVPASGNFRDPSIFYHSGTSKWWVAYTTGYPALSPSIGLASSPDLISWTHGTDIDESLSFTDLWAPEWFVDSDGTVRIFFAGTSATNHKIYEIHATNSTLTAWSSPVEVTGTGYPANAIDPHVLLDGTTYYLTLQDNTAGTVSIFSSSSVTSGYTAVTTGIGSGIVGSTGVQAPVLVKMFDGTWRLYLDDYDNHAVVATSSNLITWNTAVILTPNDMAGGTPYVTTDVNAMRSALASLSPNIPGNCRRGLVSVYNEITGDCFGMEQVNSDQSGDQPALRLFTSALNSAYIGFGYYTGTTTWTELMRIKADGTATPTKLIVGSGGTTITGIKTYAASLTPSSVGAATTAEQTFTVSGLTTADKVYVNGPSPTAGTGIVGARVSGANTLALTFVNATAGSLTPAAGTYNIVAIRS